MAPCQRTDEHRHNEDTLSSSSPSEAYTICSTCLICSGLLARWNANHMTALFPVSITKSMAGWYQEVVAAAAVPTVGGLLASAKGPAEFRRATPLQRQEQGTPVSMHMDRCFDGLLITDSHSQCMLSYGNTPPCTGVYCKLVFTVQPQGIPQPQQQGLHASAAKCSNLLACCNMVNQLKMT